MIQIESVTIRELRGIRELHLTPGRKNFVVSGPNGSGKSGVVDAIQFALTGEISRLTGKGTGGLTLQRHGPHVDRRDDPAVAEVQLGLYLPEADKSAVLTRNIKTAKRFTLEPEDQALRAVIGDVAQHPELSLSRREIIKYIIVEAGQRSKEIQALLKLEEIGTIRGVLKTTANRIAIEHRIANEKVSDAEDALRRHLDLVELSPDGITAVVNPKREILGLPVIAELLPDTKLTAGLDDSAPRPAFDKQAVLRDVAALQDAQARFPTLGKEEAKQLVGDLAVLDGDPALLAALTRRSFVEGGLALVDSAECPLCDTEWEGEEQLKAHLRAKLSRSHEAEALQERALAAGSTLAGHARTLSSLLKPVVVHSEIGGSTKFSASLVEWTKHLDAFAAALSTVDGIGKLKDELEADWISPPLALSDELPALSTPIVEQPDQAASMAAHGFLSIAEDRLLSQCRGGAATGKRGAGGREDRLQHVLRRERGVPRRPV